MLYTRRTERQRMKGSILWVSSILGLGLGLGLAGPGCGSSPSPVCPDAGCPDGSTPQLWGLSRGASTYLMTSITDVSDGCMYAPARLGEGPGLMVTYDETARTVSVGASEGSPAQPAFGAGRVAGNLASLVRDNENSDGTGCTWHQRDASAFALVYHDRFTLAVEETRTGFSASCPLPPPSGTCVSRWTWTLEKTQ
jgi:hypothetical protein